MAGRKPRGGTGARGTPARGGAARSAPARPIRAVVFDLSHATFVDSAVLGALLRARTRAEREGADLVLVLGDGREPAIPRIFEITGLLRTFRTARNREEALQSLRGGSVAA